MITIPKLKKDMELNKSLGNIIDILKTTAIMRFHSFQFKKKPNPLFVSELEKVFVMLKARGVKHPYLFDRKSLPSAILVITSDEGFLGGLNALLVNAAMEHKSSDKDEVIVVGERGVRYLEEMKENFVSFPGISDDVKYEESESVAGYLLKSYKKRFGRIFVSYPRFISLTTQKIEVSRLLPYAFGKETYSEEYLARAAEDLLMEPSAEKVAEAAIEMWTKFSLYKIFWMSKQSEEAARIVHLEGSTQAISGINQELRFNYFRRIHALSDKTIREISAARLLLGQKR